MRSRPAVLRTGGGGFHNLTKPTRPREIRAVNARLFLSEPDSYVRWQLLAAVTMARVDSCAQLSLHQSPTLPPVRP
jgi:hypothetical protein